MSKPNKIERLKSECRPGEFLSRIETLDWHHLDENDRFYLKNYGIYNHKLTPDRFMLRLRITAGRLSLEQLRTILDIASIYTLEPLLTMRAQMELHGLTADTVYEVWRGLERAGISCYQTLTDNFRTIVTDPLDGLLGAESIETYSLIEEMERLFLGNPDYMGMLPRKFNTAICGTAVSSHSFFSNDLYMGLATKEGRMGFNLYLGGKNSEVAVDADIFVEKEKAVTLFEAVAQSYLKYGLRGTRSKTRLFHLLQAIGMETFRAHIQSFYPETLESAGVYRVRAQRAQEFTRLKDGRYAFCYPSHYGAIKLDTLQRLYEYAESKSLSIRLGIDQNLYLVGLEEQALPFARHKDPLRISVCAGSHYCPLSLFDMKEEAGMLPLDRLRGLGIAVGYSGCLKGCGKHQHVDIGLIGLRTAIYGPTQKSVRLFLGSQHSNGKSVARLIFMAIPLHGLNDLLGVILDTFELSEFEEFELFSRNILNRFSTDFLALWFLAKHYTSKPIPLKAIHSNAEQCHTLEEERQILKHDYEELELWSEEGAPFHKGIQKLSQALWREEVE
jgi:ferredoxin-nitrite reductase